VTKYRPVLPNRKSPHQTPASLRVDLHYAHLGVIARWDWDRFLRLAAFLNYTPQELASVICLQHGKLARAEQTNRFPGPAALLLTLLEAQAMKDFSADIIKAPFPHDSPQGSQA
jgi:hypothetical protein